MADKSAETPTYIAQCPECDSLIACCVADVENVSLMRDAVRYRVQWTRAGYNVSTVTVQDVRTWPSDKAFQHTAGCGRDKRKAKQAKQESLI